MTADIPPLAITGATGFVGRRVLALAGARPVRALTRRPQPPQPGVEWVLGDLNDRHALARLCDGAAAVLHIAGVVNAPDAAGFHAGNVTGTANVLAAAAAVPRIVHVSSLAAREPGLSIYGASKAAGDRQVQARDGDWLIVRPPGVYGPGDAEMRDLFALARFGLGVAPGGPAARISLIHVNDLARALLALADAGPSRTVLEIDDGAGAQGGHSHAGFARAIGRALGRRPLVLPIPGGLLTALAASRLIPKLTPDRARYLAHPDWVARGGNDHLAGLWQPQIDLAAGLADTVRDYRARGWL
ncbi:NAD-dependent epimerase/dehydratase family protein [Sandarakinorhabdus cyanobacteriorum]|uniref:NAD-dependent epimerase/dehydratase family protein n=1 Tax=Sandarakinorhabdus cyanobacteriorum TaxID=1981098 RepID=UPI001A9C778A|nr:NAD-dependent epimerase/dehydratase family protein [Sandarakinorhabdus cyanobacteriorum]